MLCVAEFKRNIISCGVYYRPLYTNNLADAILF